MEIEAFFFLGRFYRMGLLFFWLSGGKGGGEKGGKVDEIS